jgi:hypothetical protein
MSQVCSSVSGRDLDPLAVLCAGAEDLVGRLYGDEHVAAEVERTVLERFEAALSDTFDATTDAVDAATWISKRLAGTIGPDSALRHYVRRAVLEATPAGPAILGRLVELTKAVLDRFAPDLSLPGETDTDWLAIQIVTVNLSATLLEPLIEDVLGRQPFTAHEVQRRTDANLRFLTSALANLSSPPRARRRHR